MPFDSIDYEVKCRTTEPGHVRELIAWLEAGKGPGFDMSLYLKESDAGVWAWDQFNTIFIRCSLGNNWCGTHACIAGHAIILALSDGFKFSGCGVFTTMAGEYLGINCKKQAALFSHDALDDPHSIPEAVAKLEALLVPV